MKFQPLQRIVLPLYLISCCLALPLSSRLKVEASGSGATPKRLVIALDGVPFTVIAELRAEGCFRRFHDPARQVSTFPSITSPAMVEILHAPDSPGYEDHFYDREHNRLVGGVQGRLRGGSFIKGTWREQFDYHAPAFKGALGYVAAPVGAMVLAQLDLSAFKKAFRKSTAPEFIGYIGETDSLAHLGGKEAQKSFLRTLDRTLEELIAESGGQLEVEMFSDHGNDFAKHRKVDLNAPIKQAGFEIDKNLKHVKSVVLPKYGLIGCGALFTAPENRASLAEVCAAVNGVDFAAYKEAGDGSGEECEAVVIISRRGRARIKRAQDRFSYELIKGDPLELSTVASSLRERGLMDAAGFASGAEWLKATGDHQYVDPLRRIFDGLTSHVQTLADVIVSCEDGWYIGNQFFDTVTHLCATHGNLRRGETEGFAISTRQTLDSMVRGYQLSSLFELGRVLHADAFFGNSDGHCQFGKALAQIASQR